MPKRVDDGVAINRDGKPIGRLFSPKAAVYYIRNELHRSIGESTMRLWRSKGTGPVFHRDEEGQLWYHEKDLIKFYSTRPEMRDGRSGSMNRTKAVDVENLIPSRRVKLRLPDSLRHPHRPNAA
jgi:hypothetical protein